MRVTGQGRRHRALFDHSHAAGSSAAAIACDRCLACARQSCSCCPLAGALGTGSQSDWLGGDALMWWSHADVATYRGWLAQAGLQVTREDFGPGGRRRAQPVLSSMDPLTAQPDCLLSDLHQRDGPAGRRVDRGRLLEGGRSRTRDHFRTGKVRCPTWWRESTTRSATTSFAESWWICLTGGRVIEATAKASRPRRISRWFAPCTRWPRTRTSLAPRSWSCSTPGSPSRSFRWCAPATSRH